MNAVHPSQSLGKPNSYEKQEHTSHPLPECQKQSVLWGEHTFSDC